MDRRPSLSVIPGATALPVAHNTHHDIGARIQRLQSDARLLATERAAELCRAAINLTALAEEIVEGGEAYPAGVRDEARRFAASLRAYTNTIDAIMRRAGR